MAAVVYFSSASNSTARFVEHCAFEDAGIHTARIPLRPADKPLHIDEPFVLICPTYGGGEATKAVPVQVKRFLNDPANRQWIRGVIAAGNTNFGTAYAAAGPIIARKCHVPLMYRFELMGTSADVRAVRKGLIEFFRTQSQDQP
ncbi:ribonucleotide reductase [Bifidobacterium pseudolongum subsp. globosum]|uniref:Protein NrdI n=1 Tax=Bifidobacterium pseudolongum subsp. globosum TaxID=1690 RepID=A0A4Q5A3W9_9BIFI|nr:class Ib ribonucleoside-diphosphate reductase assembly flavoprotein NrdI [Bifidobacterium pseudolongum]RYQ11667.1 ribonucleotide reductase [Bifidobacterium pseudolongum subsp. globosum]